MLQICPQIIRDFRKIIHDFSFSLSIFSDNRWENDLARQVTKKVIESLSGRIKKPFVYHKTQNSNKSWFIKIEYLKIIQIYTFKKQYLH